MLETTAARGRIRRRRRVRSGVVSPPGTSYALLEVADACRAPGEVGALLRREGLYSSQLTQWRRARREGTLKALSRPRGPRGRRRDEVVVENEQLRKENARLRRRLEQAQTMLEIQKKGAHILNLTDRFRTSWYASKGPKYY